jgi:hypothetical protein
VKACAGSWNARSRAAVSTSSKHLDLKVHLFMAGGALVLAGIYFNNHWVMWGALVVLAAAFGLRFLPGADAAPQEDVEFGIDDDSGT